MQMSKKNNMLRKRFRSSCLYFVFPGLEFRYLIKNNFLILLTIAHNFLNQLFMFYSVLKENKKK